MKDMWQKEWRRAQLLVPRIHNVVGSKPQPGDVIILLGKRTGRNSCGGATGLSKEHDELSLVMLGAEAQKDNTPTS